jgi:hypothetical protein
MMRVAQHSPNPFFVDTNLTTRFLSIKDYSLVAVLKVEVQSYRTIYCFDEPGNEYTSVVEERIRAADEPTEA